ncbi:hypothetical protein BGW38_002349 [Lunasporangiospora selenospora]|uniref:Arf-GAP domain-containing protein n=1 Tax=Lunasporangiospora selenospora TaxID=979761 RepID=A0A9P6FSQ1_9FUNG|nr:hypothetical protein BGW38_002349 [Lunasporangiospora selenospora]
MTSRHARTTDKTINEKHTRILRILLQKPENKYCVDCRQKVKSVDLDSWTTEQVENMIRWGNEKANKFWEAQLPESSIPNGNTLGIDNWIRTKYEWRQYANRNQVPNPDELGPIDEQLLQDLHGKLGPRHQIHINRSAEPTGPFTGILAPPPSDSARLTNPKRASVPASGLQGSELFSIAQSSVTNSGPRPNPASANVDFFGLHDPTPQPTTAAQDLNKRMSMPLAPTSQGLFSFAPPPTSSVSQGPVKAPATPVVPVAPVASVSLNPPQRSSVDWKNSIMSLYGNQETVSKRASMGSQPSQQIQHPPAVSSFGPFQGGNTFGIQQEQRSQQQQQSWQSSQNNGMNPHGGMDAWQQQNSMSAFSTLSGNGQTQQPLSNFGHGVSKGSSSSGGDLFSMIAGTPSTASTNSTISSPSSQQNKQTRYEKGS